MKKVYFYQIYDPHTAYGPFESIEEVLNEIREEGESPDECKFYEAVKGEYVPPSSPETVRFPS